RRLTIMRIRKGVPLLVALVGLFAANQVATATHCGAGRFSGCADTSCDAQCCYSACQQQNRVCYKLVYDTVEEKRWHTTYKTVCETVNKQVTKTCYRDECKTVCRPVTKTCYKEVQCTVNRPVVETCMKEVHCKVTRK